MCVDYDRIAKHYDAHRGPGQPYIETLLSVLEACPGRRVLELGAGTGNSAAALARRTPCEITALDISQGMLRQGVEKQLPARWLRASALHLPFREHSFDFVFATYMLHYIRDLDILMAECARVLERGCAAFVTAPTVFIRNHPMNEYFPSLASVDLARFQPIETVEAALRAAGFSRVAHEQKSRAPEAVNEAYVEKVAAKYVSTFGLLPPGEFETGLARLRAEVAGKRRPGLTVTWETVTIWGWRE